MTDAAKERNHDAATGNADRRAPSEPLAGSASIAVMQPYFFPYLGYFQLMRSVETFVVYDDVQFIPRGWINRNYVLAAGRQHRLTLELRGGSRNREIREIGVGGNRLRLLKMLRQTYAKAPYAQDALAILGPLLQSTEDNLSLYLVDTLRSLAAHFQLPCAIKLSSTLAKAADLRGQERILNVCRALRARSYVNAPGGRTLYAREAFAEQGIQLLFAEPRLPSYRQFGGDFVSGLSIIDVMMFNPPERIREMLLECELRE